MYVTERSIRKLSSSGNSSDPSLRFGVFWGLEDGFEEVFEDGLRITGGGNAIVSCC